MQAGGLGYQAERDAPLSFWFSFHIWGAAGWGLGTVSLKYCPFGLASIAEESPKWACHCAAGGLVTDSGTQTLA